MSNIFYGTALLDDEQVEKALKTDEGVERAAKLVLSLKKNNLLPFINKYSKVYDIPREYLFGIILDEQFRSHSKDEIVAADIGDSLLSYFSPSDISIGIAQTEPLLVGKCIIDYGYFPNSAGGKEVLAKLEEEEESENKSYSDPSEISSDFYEFVATKLTKDHEFVIEIVAFLLSYYRDEWRSNERLNNLENWHDSIDEWDVIAYTYSLGLEALIEKGSIASPEERKAAGMDERPSGSSRGRGIGQIGRKALETLDSLDGDKDIQESKKLVESAKVKRMIRKAILDRMYDK